MPITFPIVPDHIDGGSILPIRSLAGTIAQTETGEDISKYQEDNFSGIQIFDFVPSIDVQFFPPINKALHTIDGAIILKPDKDWIRIYSTLGTMRFQEKKKSSSNGFHYSQSLEFSVPKDREEITALFSEMEQFKYICKYKDLNSKWKLLGTLDNPYEFMNDLDTGSSPERTLNAHSCSFVCESARKAPFYVNDIAAAITGIGVMKIGSTFKIN